MKTIYTLNFHIYYFILSSLVAFLGCTFSLLRLSLWARTNKSLVTYTRKNKFVSKDLFIQKYLKVHF